jgi:hypothetical protein
MGCVHFGLAREDVAGGEGAFVLFVFVGAVEGLVYRYGRVIEYPVERPVEDVVAVEEADSLELRQFPEAQFVKEFLPV